MKRTTISLPDALHEAVEDFRHAQDVPPPLSSLVQSALREYLARRGHARDVDSGDFRITPARYGSGSDNTSLDHDRYIAEAASRR